MSDWAIWLILILLVGAVIAVVAVGYYLQNGGEGHF